MGPSLSFYCQQLKGKACIEWLTKIDSRIESTISTEKVQSHLAIVVLVGFVNLRLRQHEKACARVVPLELDLVGLVESLLRDRRVKIWHVEDFDSGGESLDCV